MKSYRYDTAHPGNVLVFHFSPKRTQACPHPSGEMAEKVDSRAMREVNRSIVLDMIRRSGTISRTDLARRSALTKPTVGAIVDGLLAAGIIHEVGLDKALRGGGRPARLLALNGESAAYAALSFAAGSLRAAISDATGELRSVLETELQPGDPLDAVHSGLGLMREALDQAGFLWSKVSGVGVVVAGAVDGEAGMCVEAPQLGWNDVDLVRALEPIGDIPVVVSSSCNASAFAESRIGVAEACESFVWLEVDRSVSAGIVIHGQVFHGRGGLSGEIGRCHVLPGGQRLDEVASSGALEKSYQAARDRDGLGEPASAEQIVRAARAGDPLAGAVLRRLAQQLGSGICQVFNLLSPEMVVLGGLLASAGGVFVESIEQAVQRGCLRPTHGEIRLSSLGPNAALRGALLSAMERNVPSFRLVATTRNVGAG